MTRPVTRDDHPSGQDHQFALDIVSFNPQVVGSNSTGPTNFNFLLEHQPRREHQCDWPYVASHQGMNVSTRIKSSSESTNGNIRVLRISALPLGAKGGASIPRRLDQHRFPTYEGICSLSSGSAGSISFSGLCGLIQKSAQICGASSRKALTS